MGEWGSYSLEDFLLFQPRVYWRLFEIHNEAVWPLHIAALLLGVAVVALAVRPAPWFGRSLAIALGAAWLWVAWSFLWQRYATINWAIAYVAPVFALQGLALAWAGAARQPLWSPSLSGWRGGIGLALCLYAVVLHPLTAVLFGRPVQAAEVFAIAPDPTAIATLGLVSMVPGRAAALLLVVPVLWCGLSALTLYAMSAPEAVVPLAAAALAIAGRISGHHREAPW